MFTSEKHLNLSMMWKRRFDQCDMKRRLYCRSNRILFRWKAILMVFGVTASAIVILWETTSVHAPDTRANVELQLNHGPSSVVHMGQDVIQNEAVAMESKHRKESVAMETNHGKEIAIETNHRKEVVAMETRQKEGVAMETNHQEKVVAMETKLEEAVPMNREEAIEPKENNYFEPDENNNVQLDEKVNGDRTNDEDVKEPLEQVLQLKENGIKNVEKLSNDDRKDENADGDRDVEDDEDVREDGEDVYDVKEKPKRKVANIMENIKKSIQSRKPLKHGVETSMDGDIQSEEDGGNNEWNEDENNNVVANDGDGDVEDNENDAVEDPVDNQEREETAADKIQDGDEKIDQNVDTIKEENEERDGDDGNQGDISNHGDGERDGDDGNHVDDGNHGDDDDDDEDDNEGNREIDENAAIVDEEAPQVDEKRPVKPKRTRYANFFSEQPVGFDDVELIRDEDLGIDNGIPMEPFIKACYGFMPMIDFFGVSFSKAKSDLEKNIGRIKERYDSDPERFTVIQRMLAAEFDVPDDEQLATKGVRWIKRSMEFTKELLLNIQRGLSLSQSANEAYDKTLIQYHNWFLQKIFRVGFATLGDREDLLDKMASHPEYAREPEFLEVLYVDMDKYLNDLQRTLDIITRFFDKYDIEN